MAVVRIDRNVQTAQGQAIAGALFYVLAQPADVDTLTPLANVFSSTAGGVAANPQITDGLGQVGFYLDNTQLYTFVVVSPLIDTQSYPDQSLGSSAAGVTFVPVGEVPQPVGGSTTVFALSAIPQPGTLLLQVNLGVPTNGLGYTLPPGSNILTLANPLNLSDGDTIYANYFK